VILEYRGETFALEFPSRPELYLFQQALTGYEVVDNYMPYVQSSYSILPLAEN
jgi:hypothetical protein